MICAVSFSTLTLYVQQASGNPFLNFFGQSIAETPAHLLGTILVDRIGRRLTNSSTSFMAAVFCIPAMFLCTCKYWTPQIFYIQRNSNWLIHWIPFIECLDQGYEYLGNLSMVAVKFWTAITFFAVYLQGSEMYPTCLRQTGLSMGAIGSNLTGIFSPYIAYLVSEWDDSIWIVYKTEAFELFFPSKYYYYFLALSGVIWHFCGLSALSTSYKCFNNWKLVLHSRCWILVENLLKQFTDRKLVFNFKEMSSV